MTKKDVQKKLVELYKDVAKTADRCSKHGNIADSQYWNILANDLYVVVRESGVDMAEVIVDAIRKANSQSLMRGLE